MLENTLLVKKPNIFKKDTNANNVRKHMGCLIALIKFI